jgi:NAD(P)-dependent dehydrogenase (short-subunit alcohol dehydrogenase family)
MNEELANELVKEIGGGKTKFFECNVLETESVDAAVKGALAWVKETGKEIGGVVAAAGVSNPAKVSRFCSYLWCMTRGERTSHGGDLRRARGGVVCLLS